jgi:hypothetical protein
MSEFEQKDAVDSGSDEEEVPESEKTPVTIGMYIFSPNLKYNFYLYLQ